jgi:hypothetical protein
MAKKSILGISVPHTADSHDFVQFVESVYKAADSNYLSAGRFLGVSAMVVWNLLHGRQKDSKQIRKHLDILPLMAPAPVCPTHATVHCFDCQTQAVIPLPAETQPAKSRPKSKRVYPGYAKMRTDDIDQARRQVEKHYPGYEITRKER